MMTAVVVIEAVVIALLLILVAGLLKSHAEILRALDRHGGETTMPAPAERLGTTGLGRVPTENLSGNDANGREVSISLAHGRGETLLAFLSTGCASCRVFWAELAGKAPLPTPSTRAVIVTKGPGSESPGKVRQLAPDNLQIVMSDQAWDDFRVPLTPYFMLVDGNGGVLGEGSATNLAHLRDLFRQAAADADPTKLDTRGRERFTDDQLTRSGIEPGDPSLYENPLRE